MKLIDVDTLLEETDRIYTEHYADCTYKCVQDIFNAIKRMLRKYQNIDVIYLTKEKYEELLEYKHMYEDLCK